MQQLVVGWRYVRGWWGRLLSHIRAGRETGIETEVKPRTWKMCACEKEINSSAPALCESDERARASVYDGVEHGSVSTGRTVFQTASEKARLEWCAPERV